MGGIIFLLSLRDGLGGAGTLIPGWRFALALMIIWPMLTWFLGELGIWLDMGFAVAIAWAILSKAFRDTN